MYIYVCICVYMCVYGYICVLGVFTVIRGIFETNPSFRAKWRTAGKV